MTYDASSRRDGDARSVASSGAGSTNGGMSRDAAQFLVPPAMLVVAIAMAVASQIHLGLSVEIAVAVGISLFCLMLMCHVLLRVADEAERAAEDAAERGLGQVASPMPAAPPAGSIGAEPLDGAGGGRVAPHAGVPVSGHAQVMPQSADEALGAAPGWSFRPVDLMQPRSGPAAEAAAFDAPDLRALGDFRPTYAEHRLETPPDAGAMRLSVDHESDRIDAILKRLANQIHAGAAERQQAAETVPVATAGLPVSATQAATVGGADADGHRHPLEELAVSNPDSALACAVDALRSTVEAMRGGAVPAEPELSAAEVGVAAVAEAIQAECADVFLSPILGLADQSARHFEVSVKLRVDMGDEHGIAEGAGLLPLLDALLVRRAAGFASMLERRGRDGAVFSRIAGKSLESGRFVEDVAVSHAHGVADRMVLSFAQDEMRGLGPAQFTALEDLARLGFRFSLQGVADLDMDFDALRALGFEFVKLDAAVFQAGLFCDGETVPASDICEHFQDLGLSVIVADIADAETRDRLVGWGVAYGQGALFGAPRPVPVATAVESTMAA